MSVKKTIAIQHLLFTTLFFAGLLQAGAQTSSWLLPLGTSGGSRSNPTLTGAQKIDSIQIKWRNSRLKNSSVLLVGAIRSEANDSTQQIIGITEGSKRVTILKGNGFLEAEFPIALQDPTVSSLTLTGLFATGGTPHPDLIGLGIERQFNGPDTTNGWLLDRDGNPRFKLGLLASDERESVPNRMSDSNRILTILPFAMRRLNPDTLAVFATVTQNKFQPDGNYQMLNSIRRYLLAEQSGKVIALGIPISITPKLYAQPPAVLSNQGHQYLAVSTTRYSFSPPISRTNPATSSGTAHALNYNIDSAIAPVLIANNSSPDAFSLTSQLSSLGPSADNKFFRITAEQGNQGGAISLYDIESGDLVESIAPDPSAKGWHIVVANIDDQALSGSDYLVRNPGPEIVATAINDNSENVVYLLRWNSSAPKPPGQSSNFHYFAKQRIDGEVMAAGDIVQEGERLIELILAEGNKLSILQLEPYTNTTAFENDRPLKTLKSFTLNSNIVSVAIADIDGDKENDIIVSTVESTYAIGKIQPNPFPVAGESLGKKVCIDDTLRLYWNRQTLGSGTDIEARVIGPNNFSRTLDVKQRKNDSIHIQVGSGLSTNEPGAYQLVIQDSEFPWIRQVSEPFHIAVPTLDQFLFDGVVSVTPGAILRDTISSCCINPEDIFLERQIVGRNEIERPFGSLQIGDTTIIVTTIVPCPGVDGCEAIDEGAEILYRLQTKDVGTRSANILRIQVPQAENISVEEPANPDENRTRTLFWKASEFPCSSLIISIANVGESNWQEIGTFDASAESVEFEVPPGYFDSLRICIRCADDQGCTFGSASFKVNRVTGAYIAPNPFNPGGLDISGQGATIVYALQETGNVSISIYDGARALVRKVVEGEVRNVGRNRDFWDGRNSLGEIVANGTYICVISSDAGEQIVLYLAVVKSQ
ncbi:MAG: hypothetical protein R3F28_07800 [Candidatus Kapaibacterium sp.]